MPSSSAASPLSSITEAELKELFDFYESQTHLRAPRELAAFRMLRASMGIIEDLLFGDEDWSRAEELVNKWHPTIAEKWEAQRGVRL